MSKLSRRALLGTGTATAATLLAGGAPAEAADTAVRRDTTAQTQFDNGTTFSGTVHIANEDDSELRISFSVATAETPAANDITPLDVAAALNTLAASRGWPHMTFYGTPSPAPLN